MGRDGKEQASGGRKRNGARVGEIEKKDEGEDEEADGPYVMREVYISPGVGGKPISAGFPWPRILRIYFPCALTLSSAQAYTYTYTHTLSLRSPPSLVQSSSSPSS